MKVVKVNGEGYTFHLFSLFTLYWLWFIVAVLCYNCLCYLLILSCCTLLPFYFATNCYYSSDFQWFGAVFNNWFLQPVSYAQLARSIHELAATSDQVCTEYIALSFISFPSLTMLFSVVLIFWVYSCRKIPKGSWWIMYFQSLLYITPLIRHWLHPFSW